MANYIGRMRSNYFRVKDDAKFTEFMDGLCGGETNIELEDSNPNHPGCFMFMCSDLPVRIQDDGDWDEAFDFFDELRSHLVKDEIVVVQECGYEKMRYLIGKSYACKEGSTEVLTVCINDIYKKAICKWGLGLTHTEATY